MARKTDRDQLKQYFRSGTRPTQEQFHELIDNCYNYEFSTFVSGYQLKENLETNKTKSDLEREKGLTTVVPFFENINTKDPQIRVFNYGIPVSNLGEGYLLERISLEMNLPKNSKYSVKDKRTEVQIDQKVVVENIRIYNGTDEIFATKPEADEIDSKYTIKIGKASKHWKGIGIDIVISYDIKSEIAVSDQLEISNEKPEKLKLTFGSAGCVFKPGK